MNLCNLLSKGIFDAPTPKGCGAWFDSPPQVLPQCHKGLGNHKGLPLRNLASLGTFEVFQPVRPGLTYDHFSLKN